MNSFALIGAASGWGAGFREAQDGPQALREFGLAERLAVAGIDVRWTAMIESEKHWRAHPDLKPPETFGLVARHSAQLADAVEEAMAARRLPVVLGGDHAIAIGSWAGVARALGRAPLGLIWIDAHLDAHTVATTPSMNPHGMGAAVLLGHGEPAFLAIGGAVIRPENLCYIGVRSYEDGEWALLRRLGVRVFFMDEVEACGMANVIATALAIATRGTAGFGVTIDLDGFDPAEAPGIGLKVPNGLKGGAVAAALRGIARHPKLRGLEIVEYIPSFDEAQRTAWLVHDLLRAALAPAPARAARRLHAV